MDKIGSLPCYTGPAACDGSSSFSGYLDCTHVLCNDHYLRILRFFYKQYGQIWTADLRLCRRLAHYLKLARSPPLTDTLKAYIEPGTTRS
jgi:hypothetical protein